MRQKPFLLTFILCAAAACAPHASAQAKKDADPCETRAAEITTLGNPAFDSSSVWDVSYAKEGMDAFTDAAPAEKGVVAVGAFTKDAKDKIYHPLLAAFDEKHKVLWETREDTPAQKIIQRIVPEKGGFAVLGDVNDAARGGGIYVAHYDEKGKKIGKEADIFESGGELDSKTIVRARDGGGWIVAAQFIDGKNAEKRRGIIYRIADSGATVWKRSFLVGRATMFNDLVAAQDGTYLIAGQIVLDGNESGGWIVNIDGKGALLWQRNYPRGKAAAFDSVGQTKGGDLILTGKARPSSSKNGSLAAWIMKTNPAGDPDWQRYFKGGSYSFEAVDTIVYEDGRSSVLIKAGIAGKGEGLRSHARLVTFSPEGLVIRKEAFTDGENAAPARLVPGNDGERLIAGYIQGKPAPDGEDVASVSSFDGWLVAAPSLEIYDDSCAEAPELSPILQ